MSTIKSILGNLSGAIGEIVFSTRNGQTVAYPKSDNPDPRTKKQVNRRCRIGNMGAFYKACEGALRKAFEGKLPRQNYFNLFVKNNFREDSMKVYLTKEQKNAGTCVVAPYMISCGSLRTIGAEFVNGVYQSGISLPNLSIGASTTIGDFSTEVIRSNKVLNFKDGDKITFIAAKQCTRNDVPFAQVEQNWLTLNQQDTRILWQVVAQYAFASSDGHLSTSGTPPAGGYAWIHSRQLSDYENLVSTETLCCTNPLLADYTSDYAFERAAQSYGGYNEVVLVADGTSGSTDLGDADDNSNSTPGSGSGDSGNTGNGGNDGGGGSFGE